jgi:hypothetical protein
MGTAAADDHGRVLFEDETVTPGGLYNYRVSAVVHGAERFYGEAQVQVPLFALTVRPVAGNPVRQNMSITFTLPTREPAKLELFDVRGRLVETLEVGQMGVGRHVMEFGSRNQLASGVYIVRLSQSGRTTSSKVALLR